MSIECAVTGQLGQPPQQRTSAGGKRWASFSLAVGTGDEREWVQVAVFGPLIDELPPDLEKGEKLYVEGKLKLSRWEDAKGSRSSLQVAASRVLVLNRLGMRRKPVRREESAATEVATAKPLQRSTRRADFAMPNDPVPF